MHIYRCLCYAIFVPNRGMQWKHFCAESGDVIEAESVCLSPVQLAGSSVQSGLWEEAGGG